MNKNLVIAFLIGIILTLIAVNYLPKFDIKIVVPEEKEIVQSEQEPVDEEKLISDSVSKKNEKNEIFFAGQNVTEDELQSILTEKEDEVRGVSNIKEFLPPQDKYKDLEKDQLNYSKPIEVKKPDDPFDKPNRPTPIKEPAVPGVNIPEPERPEISAENVATPDFGGPVFGSFSAYQDTGAIPIVRVPPQYPKRAQQRGIMGWVVVEFTVTQSGAVSNPIVLDASPPGVFNRSALRAISRWKFKPKIQNGKAVERPGVKNQIDYWFTKSKCNIPSDATYLDRPPYLGANACAFVKTSYIDSKETTDSDFHPMIKYEAPIEPKNYPHEAYIKGIEGWVLVGYSISENGTPVEVKVVDAEPPNIFNQVAIENIKKWNFRPKLVNAERVKQSGLTKLYLFEIKPLPGD